MSKPPYDQLNLGLCTSDDLDTVYQNYQILKQALSLPNYPYCLNQIHDNKVVNIHSSTSQTADGAYTSLSNEVCFIQTADCLPILLCNKAGTEIAALHGGWRGLATGIIEEGVKKFRSSPKELLAWLGPAISINDFEVG